MTWCYIEKILKTPPKLLEVTNKFNVSGYKIDIQKLYGAKAYKVPQEIWPGDWLTGP